MPANLTDFLETVFVPAGKQLEQTHLDLHVQETGQIMQVGNGIVKISGLPGVKADELVRFAEGSYGIAFNLEPDQVSVIMLGKGEQLQAGMAVSRSFRLADVPVGPSLLGRMVDPLGNPLDDGPPIDPGVRYPIERPAPAILDRAPVNVPLETGILAIDMLFPIGRGQRELILGDRQIGKTSLALTALINQRDKNVLCIYCSIGQPSSAMAKMVAGLRQYKAMDYTVVVVAEPSESPGLNYIAPFAATSMAEYFMEQGRDVLIIYDDLSRHARTYRELSLLMRRPPAREAYPGDIFYLHSRLLERSTHLIPEKGGGSLTALPIVETEGQNIAAYIPTNLVSITDGQIYLSPKLFQEGILPAIDMGRSVSRVGGKAQYPACRAVSGNLRLSYSQFEELEVFERFSTRLDEATRNTLQRGYRIRELLKQPQWETLQSVEQIVLLEGVLSGVLDQVPLADMAKIKAAWLRDIIVTTTTLYPQIRQGGVLSEQDRQFFREKAESLLKGVADGIPGGA